MKTRCYFDSDHICLGTINDFYSDYYASDDIALPEDYNPKGKRYTQILNETWMAVHHSINTKD